jgi:hypothetical protein
MGRLATRQGLFPNERKTRTGRRSLSISRGSVRGNVLPPTLELLPDTVDRGCRGSENSAAVGIERTLGITKRSSADLRVGNAKQRSSGPQKASRW